MKGLKRMNIENTSNVRPHNLIMEDRKSLSISAVNQVDSFDEQTVYLYTDMGQLTIKGNNLHLDHLNTDTGDITITGTIHGMMYTNDQTKNGFISRIFK